MLKYCVVGEICNKVQNKSNSVIRKADLKDRGDSDRGKISEGKRNRIYLLFIASPHGK